MAKKTTKAAPRKAPAKKAAVKKVAAKKAATKAPKVVVPKAPFDPEKVMKAVTIMEIDWKQVPHGRQCKLLQSTRSGFKDR